MDYIVKGDHRAKKVAKRSNPKMVVTNRSIITVQKALADRAQKATKR